MWVHVSSLSCQLTRTGPTTLVAITGTSYLITYHPMAPGTWSSIENSSYQFRNFCCRDKRSYCLIYNIRISYTDKTFSALNQDPDTCINIIDMGCCDWNKMIGNQCSDTSNGHQVTYIIIYEECCARSRCQGQGQVIASHRYCGM